MGSIGLFEMKREYSIYRTLKRLSKQRVGMILQPGNVWVIEKALPRTDENEENLQTCLMRGWIEILHESVPMGVLGPNAELPDGQSLTSKEHIYRLTEGGWNALHRTHVIGILSIITALIGLVLA